MKTGLLRRGSRASRLGMVHREMWGAGRKRESANTEKRAKETKMSALYRAELLGGWKVQGRAGYACHVMRDAGRTWRRCEICTSASCPPSESQHSSFFFWIIYE